MRLVFLFEGYSIFILKDRGIGRFQVSGPSGDLEISTETGKALRGSINGEDCRFLLRWVREHSDLMSRETADYADVFSVGKPLPRIAAVMPVGERKVHVT